MSQVGKKKKKKEDGSFLDTIGISDLAAALFANPGQMARGTKAGKKSEAVRRELVKKNRK